MSAELLWAAGFFDGEGGTYRYDDGYLKVKISQVDRRVLDRFRDAVSTGYINGPYEGARPGWSPRFVYQASSKDAEKLLRAIWPHIGVVKREQATGCGFSP